MVNIVIPMAGRGRRFVEAGYLKPKPLIEVLGAPMFTWALKSLPLALADRLIFLCLEEHLDKWPLGKEIEARYAAWHPIVIQVSKVTEGQVSTVLLAYKYIDNKTGLIIYNSDTYFRSPLAHALSVSRQEVAGIISVFQDTDSRWSFAKVNDQGYVIEVAEKQPISSWATTGMYYFRRGCDFVSAANEMIVRNMRVNNGFYVGPVYNLIIAKGAKVILDISDEVWCMGTPTDLSQFLRDYPNSDKPKPNRACL